MSDRRAEAERLFLEHLADEEAGRHDAALKKLQRAVRLGDLTALHCLAYYFDTREPPQTTKALRLYRQAARRGYAASANNLTRHYEIHGNKAAYFRWLRRTAELGDEDAVKELTNPAPYMFERGLEEYCTGSAEKGGAEIRRAAEWGNRDALERLRSISLQDYSWLRWRSKGANN